jgi:hypothetical protein
MCLHSDVDKIIAQEIIVKRQRELDDKLRIQENNERLERYLKNPSSSANANPAFSKSNGIRKKR